MLIKSHQVDLNVFLILCKLRTLTNVKIKSIKHNNVGYLKYLTIHEKIHKSFFFFVKKLSKWEFSSTHFNIYYTIKYRYIFFSSRFYVTSDSPASKLGTKAFTIASHYVDLPFYYNLWLYFLHPTLILLTVFFFSLTVLVKCGTPWNWSAKIKEKLWIVICFYFIVIIIAAIILLCITCKRIYMYLLTISF